MSEAEQRVQLERRPACDNCKARKTKCDRQSPCASCVTLNVTCRTTRGASEKRQRVLLSSKYEEAMQDVSRQLADVKGMLQTLISSEDPEPLPTTTTLSETSLGLSLGTPLEYTHHTPRSMIDEQVPTLSCVNEGYNGDSSFQSHVYRVKSALEAALATSDLICVEALEALPPQKVKELLRGVDTSDSTTQQATPKPLQIHHDWEIGSIPLPPIDIVLRLLRLVETNQQRFFIDVPLFKEEEFINMCRDVYFATKPVSLWVWICVNVGLYFLFLDAGRVSCERMGTTVEKMRSHTHVLMMNAEAALQSLRLCSEPSLESCRALALLGTFYVKRGHSTIAWRLISGAARACLDLGLHRIPPHIGNEELMQKYSVFWYIYAWDKGLAMTCGRTPVIHQYDVTTDFRLGIEAIGSVPSRLYGSFFEYAVITGEVQQTLFSASGQRAPQQTRIQHVKAFASRIVEIQKVVRSVSESRDDPTWDNMYSYVVVVQELMLHSLLTIVYRTLPLSSIQAHPLQCSDNCVDAARMALSTLVKVGEEMIQISTVGWGMLINVVLSLVPFVSFIVLAGNAIATTSSDDLALLSSAVAVLAPVAENSPTIQKMHAACDRFSRIAGLIVTSAMEGHTNQQKKQREQQREQHQQQEQVHNEGLAPDIVFDEFSVSGHANPATVDYSFPMAQEDWDSVMIGFEPELGDYDSRTLANIIEPYMANLSW